MDAHHFDHFVRSLTERGSRRGLFGLLAALPVLGGLLPLFPDEGDAKGRRRRRKKPHHHRKHTGNRAGKHKKRKCKVQAKTKTCAGKCGPVQNNCKKTVDCGSCDCPEPCEPCFTCASGPNMPATCVADPDQVGEPCGSEGHLCQADGNCTCQAASCPDDAPICRLGACMPCQNPTQCQIAELGDHCCGGVCRECCESADCPATMPICDDGTCTECSEDNPCPNGQCCRSDGSCGAQCPSCQTCRSGHCQAVPNDFVACDGSPLRNAGATTFCTDRTVGVGVCIDGACSCSNQVYDPDTNRCLCDEVAAAFCARNPPGTRECCEVIVVCTNGVVTEACVACP